MRHIFAFILIFLLSSAALAQDAPEATPEAAPEATSEAVPEAAPEVAPDAAPPAAPEAVPEATPETTPETAAIPYVLSARVIDLPLWRLNEALKQHPIPLTPGDTAQGPKFLYGVLPPAQAQVIELRLSAYGTFRNLGTLIVKDGEESALAAAGRKEIIVGSEPSVHPKRGVVFNTLKDTVPLAGIALKILCTAGAEGTMARLNIELLDNIEAAGTGGNRIAPIVVTRSFDIADTIPDKGAAIIIPPIPWNMVGNELDPRVQVLLIGLRTAEPADLL
jgi:hypothetical protein